MDSQFIISKFDESRTDLCDVRVHVHYSSKMRYHYRLSRKVLLLSTGTGLLERGMTGINI